MIQSANTPKDLSKSSHLSPNTFNIKLNNDNEALLILSMTITTLQALSVLFVHKFLAAQVAAMFEVPRRTISTQFFATHFALN